MYYPPTHSLAHSLIYPLTHQLAHSHTPTHSPAHSLIYPLTHLPTHSLTSSLTHLLTHSSTHSLTHQLTHSSTHSLIYPLTHLPTHSLTSSLTHLHTHSLIYTLTHSSTHSLTHQLAHSHTHLLTHLLTHLPTHSLTSSLTHSHTHSLIHSLAHSLIYPLTHSSTHSTHTLTHTHTYSALRGQRRQASIHWSRWWSLYCGMGLEERREASHYTRAQGQAVHDLLESIQRQPASHHWNQTHQVLGTGWWDLILTPLVMHSLLSSLNLLCSSFFLKVVGSRPREECLAGRTGQWQCCVSAMVSLRSNRSLEELTVACTSGSSVAWHQYLRLTRALCLLCSQ